MKARPLLFSGPMVRALLDDKKTQTRRVMKPQPPTSEYVLSTIAATTGKKTEVGKHHWVTVSPDRLRIIDDSQPAFPCPYGHPGDLLWVRESCFIAPPCWTNSPVNPCGPDKREVGYCVDGCEQAARDYAMKKTPSIHMPRWASRLTLEITRVGVERLKDISRDDAAAEGATSSNPCGGCGEKRWSNCIGCLHPWRDTPESAYRLLWESINGSGSWDTNPWVWVLEFKAHRCNVDELLKTRAA